MISSIRPNDTAAIPPARQEELRAAADKLEAAFLSEMLKSAGLEARQGEFSGGVGEDQFSSLLRDEQARQMVGTGGIGLAEHLYKSLIAREVRT